MTPLLFFWLMLKAALFSTSGSGNFPILHQDFLARGWATDQQFAESLAIGQITPGPSGLWVISMGYMVDGLRGALLALIAITLPPMLVLVIHGLYQRIVHHPGTQGFVRGLMLAVAGIYLIVLGGIMISTGVEPRSIMIALVALALGATRRVPVIVVLLLAGLAGVALY